MPQLWPKRSIWRIIRHYDFDLIKVGCVLYRLGATSYDIGMAPMLSDEQRADLIKALENAKKKDNESDEV